MTTLKQRVLEAYKATRQYHAMMALVWPREKYPRAHRSRIGGGPPACAMPFGRALRELNATDTGMGGNRTIFIPPTP